MKQQTVRDRQRFLSEALTLCGEQMEGFWEMTAKERARVLESDADIHAEKAGFAPFAHSYTGEFLELRRYTSNQRLSDETTAFAADLVLGRKKVGSAQNNGQGGSTMVWLEKAEPAQARAVRLAAEAVLATDSSALACVHGDGDLEWVAEAVDVLVAKKEEEKETQRMERWVERTARKYVAQGARLVYKVEAGDAVQVFPLRDKALLPQWVEVHNAKHPKLPPVTVEQCHLVWGA